MYKRNTEPRSRNACCRGKPINVTYSECMSVALVIQCAMHHIVICGLLGSTVFIFLCPINGTILEKKKVTERKVRFDFLCNFCLRHFLF